MKSKTTIKFLTIIALLMVGSMRMNADKLWQKVTSVDEINTDDVFAIGQTNGEYVLKGTKSKPVATSNTGSRSLINNYLLTTTIHEPDEIKLIPVGENTNKYRLQCASGEYLQGGTNSNAVLNKTDNPDAVRLEWVLVSNSNGIQIKNATTNLTIKNSTSEFSCKTSNSFNMSCLYKKVSKDGDLILTKEYDSYSSFVTLTSADYDFTDTKNLKVFIVTDANKQKVTLEEVKKVPAGTPVILYGDKNHYIAQKLSEGTVSKLSANLLKKGSNSIYGDGDTIYGIAEIDGKVGFYKVESGVNFPAGSVYLTIKESGAKNFYAFDDDETTGINGISNLQSQEDNWYNLSGMRIEAPTKKGIYIRNGRKVIVK